MLIDCDECTVRGPDACPDCVVTALLAADSGPIEIDEPSRSALDVLADGGLVAPLRLARRRAAG